MNLLTKKKAVIVAATIVIILVSCYVFFVLLEPKPPKQETMFAEIEQKEQETTEEEDIPAVIKVDVKGAVRAPGVFIARPGDRVIDLIKAAGDFNKDADLDKVNLAQLVEDQMVIYVPKIGEENVELPGGVAPSAGVTTALGTEGSNRHKVNLNTATKEELETLSGIGPAKSTAIIEYRDKTGKFQQIEDLKNISGIGDKTFEKLQDSITVK